MRQIPYFHAQACNNALANHRLLAACGQLTSDELAAKRTSFFPSIIHSLNHILTVDWFYVSALEGACIGYSAFEPEIPHPDIVSLEREQRAIDRRLIAVCDGRSEAFLVETADLIRDGWIQTEQIGRILLHLFQHQTHHRGQVHAMLSGTSVAPPQLDEFFLGHEREQALRKEDFAELGFDEDEIWR
ncbi:MAG: damage-inducible protein DinB [Rhodospirillaceae bacterium]|nr:damage-inducible protein DinB [Rhodospirillaceae bacterium]MBT6140080.1 damage-inducible protein DinB [Rhodospirillaceae bacterium]